MRPVTREVVTTQFYLPDHADNSRDWLYRHVTSEMLERVTMRFENTGHYPRTNLDIVI